MADPFFQSRVCELLQIKYPIIQAGMAGGPTTPELVAAVSEAGGLGIFGAHYLAPDDVRRAICRIRTLTDKPFAVNLLLPQTNIKEMDAGETQASLNQYRIELGLQSGHSVVKNTDAFLESLQVILEEEVPIFSCGLGNPQPWMEQLKEKQLKVIGMATTVNEAIALEEAGVDAIIAQGSDAGGHRGTFHATDNAYFSGIGTFSLVPQLVDQVSLPVLAAGGIMDGRGLVAALTLGAEGVVMGTKFLTSTESGINQAYRHALLAAKETDTVVTTVFSGRPARGLKNYFIEDMESKAAPILPFPFQHYATSDIRKEAARQGKSEYLSMWCGQGLRLLEEQGAAEIVEQVINQAVDILKRIRNE